MSEERERGRGSRRGEPCRQPSPTLDREIASRSAGSGFRPISRLTDGAIAHRRLQIALVLLRMRVRRAVRAVRVDGVVQVGAIALAGVFGMYAIEKDRHLRRLASLRGDSRRITLVVASELMFSGALAADRELLDLRDGIGQRRGAGSRGSRRRRCPPTARACVCSARRVRCRSRPSASSSPGRPVPDDARAGHEALRTHTPVRRESSTVAPCSRSPLWRGDELVAVLEAVSPAGEHVRAGRRRAGRRVRAWRDRRARLHVASESGSVAARG